jgi:hypothetical protein
MLRELALTQQQRRQEQPSPTQRLPQRPCRHHAEVEAEVVAETENPVARRARCSGGAMVSSLWEAWLLLLLLLAQLLLRQQWLGPH